MLDAPVNQAQLTVKVYLNCRFENFNHCIKSEIQREHTENYLVGYQGRIYLPCIIFWK